MALALFMLALFTVPTVFAASSTADETAVTAARELDVNFNFDLATALIIIICSVVSAAILVFCIILAKRNIHN